MSSELNPQNMLNFIRGIAPPQEPNKVSNFKALVKEGENAALSKDISEGKLSQDSIIYPHKSAEGGFDTIAWGHKIQSQEEQDRLARNGITVREADQLFLEDLEKRGFGRAKKSFDKEFGVGTYDSLPNTRKEMLAAIQYNTKSDVAQKGGFPTMSKAIFQGDYNKALENMKLDTKKIPGLARRNNLNQEYFGGLQDQWIGL